MVGVGVKSARELGEVVVAVSGYEMTIGRIGERVGDVIRSVGAVFGARVGRSGGNRRARRGLGGLLCVGELDVVRLAFAALIGLGGEGIAGESLEVLIDVGIPRWVRIAVEQIRFEAGLDLRPVRAHAVIILPEVGAVGAREETDILRGGGEIGVV